MSSSVANPQGTNVYIQRAHSVHSQAIVGRMQSISRRQAHRLRALGTTGIRNIMKMSSPVKCGTCQRDDAVVVEFDQYYFCAVCWLRKHVPSFRLNGRINETKKN